MAHNLHPHQFSLTLLLFLPSTFSKVLSSPNVFAVNVDGGTPQRFPIPIPIQYILSKPFSLDKQCFIMANSCFSNLPHFQYTHIYFLFCWDENFFRHL
jgi:hypothetical protein